MRNFIVHCYIKNTFQYFFSTIYTKVPVEKHTQFFLDFFYFSFLRYYFFKKKFKKFPPLETLKKFT